MPESKKIAVIRVRGITGVKGGLNDTMRLLALTRVNHCAVVESTPQTLGMVVSCKDYLTWGEIDKDTLAALIEKRGMLEGDKPVTDAYAKANGFDSLDAVADKVLAGQAELGALKMKRVFRLHPPRKGHRTTKKAYPYGALGNRGAEINALIRRMM